MIFSNTLSHFICLIYEDTDILKDLLEVDLLEVTWGTARS